jgi:hypothetical protein
MQTSGEHERSQSAGPYELRSAGDVGEFIDRLALLRPSDWIAALPSSQDSPSAASLQHLESVIARTRRQIDAWCATDGIETEAHIAFGCSDSSARFLADKAAAIRTAERTALALLVRAELSPDEFERLYRPFRDLIPLGDLAEATSRTARSH